MEELLKEVDKLTEEERLIFCFTCSSDALHQLALELWQRNNPTVWAGGNDTKERCFKCGAEQDVKEIHRLKSTWLERVFKLKEHKSCCCKCYVTNWHLRRAWYPCGCGG